MTRNIYALLVGIDQYVSPVSPLRGCVNDIVAVENYLRDRVAADEGYQLHLRSLKDEQATRQGIIDGFRQHLCQANRDDIVLFYYSGHGSQEVAPPEFWHLEPNRLHETLVCWDSRQPGGWDLADKELAKLIYEVSQNNPHITIIMDCCHSGSGTRNAELQQTGVRRTPTEQRSRPIESFILDPDEISQLVAASRSPEQNPSGWNIPRGRYVFLAACRDSEEAKEYYGTGEHRGAFCYFLLDTLQRANSPLSYRDVFKRTNALVRSKVIDQSPQLEATNLADLDQPFLGGAIAKRTPYFTVSYHQHHGWIIDGGAVHGIPPISGSETTQLALFPLDTDAENLHQLEKAIASARVTEVLPQISKISLQDLQDLATDLDPEFTFKAVVISLPLPPLGVCIEGDPEGIEFARDALQKASPEGQPSLYITEVTDAIAAEFRLIARDRKYIITRPADHRPLVADIDGYTPGSASLAIARLEHIARWSAIAELASPANSRIPTDAIQIKIYQGDQEIQASQIRLEYQFENGKWVQPTLRIKLINTSQEPLYCALLDLTETYAILSGFFAAGGTWIQPGEEVFAFNGQFIYATVPKELWEQGVTEFKDILKLIVSTAEFDATLLEQERLDMPRTRSIKIPGRGGKSTLNRLMNRVQTRDLLSQPEPDEVWDDWMTSQITFTTVRPQESTPITRTGEDISLGAGVTLRSHPLLTANARLTSIPQATRDLGNAILPPILRDNPELVQPFQFTLSRGTDPGLSALELNNVADPTVVTPETPLELLIDTPLNENETLMGIGYDGEFFLPVGFGKVNAQGQTEVKLERLPDPVSQGTRSLSGTVRIFFQKVVGQKLGIDYEYPLLAAAECGENETVCYERNLAVIQEKVAQAKRILLLTHSIIGDTQSMVPGIYRALVETEGRSHPLSDLYDLILTFDYESLNTKIEENAKHLKQRLATVGLTPNCGKELDIVAAGMGGLVSRWFIEQDGGNQVVSRLVMLGPPNAGSPWATIQNWTTTMLVVILNGLTVIALPARVVAAFLAKATVDAISVSLAQLQPASDFLNALAASSDPGIPYLVLAGNLSIQPAALTGNGNPVSPMERLIYKLGGTAVNMALFGQTNDVAVSVASMKKFAPGFKPQIQDVASDHFNYLHIPAGLDALVYALTTAVEERKITTEPAIAAATLPKPEVKPDLEPVATAVQPDVKRDRLPPEPIGTVPKPAPAAIPHLPVATVPKPATVASQLIASTTEAKTEAKIVQIQIERHWFIASFALMVTLLTANLMISGMLLMRSLPNSPNPNTPTNELTN